MLLINEWDSVNEIILKQFKFEFSNVLNVIWVHNDLEFQFSTFRVSAGHYLKISKLWTQSVIKNHISRYRCVENVDQVGYNITKKKKKKNVFHRELFGEQKKKFKN